MANTIGINSKSCGRGLLQMSNGLTDVFVNVRGLCGSGLAKRVSENGCSYGWRRWTSAGWGRER